MRQMSKFLIFTIGIILGSFLGAAGMYSAKENFGHDWLERYFSDQSEDDCRAPTGEPANATLNSIILQHWNAIRLTQYTEKERDASLDLRYKQLAESIEMLVEAIDEKKCITSEAELNRSYRFIGLIGVMQEKFPNPHLSNSEKVQKAFEYAHARYPKNTEEQRGRDWSKRF